MKSLFTKYRVAFVILLICGGFIFFSNGKTYGNTETEIMKAIYQEEIRNYIQCFKNVYPEKVTKTDKINKDAIIIYPLNYLVNSKV